MAVSSSSPCSLVLDFTPIFTSSPVGLIVRPERSSTGDIVKFKEELLMIHRTTKVKTRTEEVMVNKKKPPLNPLPMIPKKKNPPPSSSPLFPKSDSLCLPKQAMSKCKASSTRNQRRETPTPFSTNASKSNGP